MSFSPWKNTTFITESKNMLETTGYFDLFIFVHNKQRIQYDHSLWSWVSQARRNWSSCCLLHTDHNDYNRTYKHDLMDEYRRKSMPSSVQQPVRVAGQESCFAWSCSKHKTEGYNVSTTDRLNNLLNHPIIQAILVELLCQTIGIHGEVSCANQLLQVLSSSKQNEVLLIIDTSTVTPIT